jgi:hypothetical protein
MHLSKSERSYKAFGRWALDGVNALMSCIKILAKSRFTAPLAPATASTCYVFGNGPSMKESLSKHRELFRNGDVMCVNSFSLSETYQELQPRHYVVIDPGLWFDGNALAHQTFEAMATKCNWPMRLYVPFEARGSKPIQSVEQSNPLIEIYYINYVVYKGWRNLGFWFFRRQKAMPQCQNVMVAALFWAVNAGYRNIELYGADHNWHTQLEVDKNNVVCTRHEHFYSTEGQVQLVPFYKLASTRETFRMDEIFHAWAKVFAGYQIINAYAISRDCKIVNASEITFVDAFKRK